MRRSCVAAAILISLLASAPLASQSMSKQVWDQADLATVRLKPSTFKELTPEIRSDLERRGCTVPQVFDSKAPHNVVRGRFTSAKQTDTAVLCSKARVSSILVYRGGSTTSVAVLAPSPDRGFLQGLGDDKIGFSRSLGVASPKYITDHAKWYGKPKPPPLDHDGIDDGLVMKASVVRYWYGGKWIELQGAN